MTAALPLPPERPRRLRRIAAAFVDGDLPTLAGVTAALWLVALVAHGITGEQILAASLHSDADAWIFALTLAPLFFAVLAAASWWGVLTGVATCWTLCHLAFYRLPARRRRWLAGGVTALVFVGTPMLLNAREETRLAAVYRPNGAVTLPSLADRAVERPGATLPSGWRPPATCDAECLSLMTFGRARSVTLSFPGQEGSHAGPLAFTFRAGPIGGCVGEQFGTVCPHLLAGPVPADRLVATTVPIASVPRDAGLVRVRRLVVRDTRRPGAALTATQIAFARYPTLLDIVWGQHGFALVRRDLPLDVEARLETRLLRDLAGSRSYAGGWYPFR